MLIVDPRTGAVAKSSWSWGGILLAAALLGGGGVALSALRGSCQCQCHRADVDVTRLEEDSGYYPPIEVQLRSLNDDEAADADEQGAPIDDE